MPEVSQLSNPPTSTTAPTLPDPVSDLYTSKAQAGALTGGSAVAYYDNVGMKVHAATVNTVSPTQLKLNVPFIAGGTITFDLTGDGSANIPVVSIAA